MPQIPMPEKAGMIRHQPDAVPLHGAPGMDFNMSESRELARLGDKIGQAGLHVTDAMMRFARETAAAEDRLAEREYMTAWAEHEGELEKRMAAEPGRVEEFGAWAAESDKAWDEKAKPFLDRMTDRHRAEFAERMRAARIQSRDRRMRISFAASATRQAQAFRDNFELNCNRGDWDGASAALDAAHGVLAPAEIEKLRNSLPARREEREMRERIGYGDFDGVISTLKSDNYQGHLSPERRRMILHAAEAEQAKANAEGLQNLLDRMNNGEVVSPAEFDTPEADPKFRSDAKKLIARFQRQQETARRDAVRQKRQDDRLENLRRTDERKKQLDAREYELVTLTPPADKTARAAMYNNLKSDILTTFAGDGPAVKRLLSALDEQFKAVEKPDASYKNSYAYQRGMRWLEENKKKFTGEAQWFRRDTYHTKENYKMAQLAYERFCRANPNAAEQQHLEFLRQLQIDCNKHDCEDMAAFWNERMVAREMRK